MQNAVRVIATTTIAILLLSGGRAVGAEASHPAAKRLAVIEFTGAAAQPSVLSAITDQARGAAATELKGRDFTVMTKESMAVLLKDQGKSAACAEGECEVEVARNIGADLVLTGEVLVIEGTYIVTLKLHDVRTAALLGTRNATGKGQLELFNGVSGAGRVLLRKALGLPDSTVTGPIDEPLATDAPVPGAMLVTFAPSSGSDSWTLLDGGGKPLCRLPCQRWVPPASGYSVQLDAARKQDILRVSVPPDLGYSAGRQLEATAKSRRSGYWGGIAGGVIGGAVGFYAAYKAMGGDGHDCMRDGRTGQNCTDGSIIMGSFIGLGAGALGAWAGYALVRRDESLDVSLQDERTAEHLDVGEGKMSASAGTSFTILPNGFALQF
jgi:hypothetical protein